MIRLIVLAFTLSACTAAQQMTGVQSVKVGAHAIDAICRAEQTSGPIIGAIFDAFTGLFTPIPSVEPAPR